MAQSKPEFEKIEEFSDIVTKLVTKYPEVLDGVDPKNIVCFGITNKEPKEGKSPFEIKTVPYPVRNDVAYGFYVILNMSDWESWSDKHKALLVMDILCCLSKEGDEKVVPFDMRDHAIMFRTVGVDYMIRDDAPDILNDQIDWKY